MSDQLVPIPGERVDPAEAVLPVVVGHVVEDGVEERAGGVEGGRVQVGGVSGAHLAHSPRCVSTYSWASRLGARASHASTITSSRSSRAISSSRTSTAG